MDGEANLGVLLKTMKPKLNPGDYVFCTRKNLKDINIDDALFIFHEAEGFTIVMKKEIADNLNIVYTFVASWITLTVYSSLEAVGLTAAFSKALSDGNISCNVVAAYHHDHIFVSKEDVVKAMKVLTDLSD